MFVGIYRKIIIPGFLRWCRIASIHSTSSFDHALRVRARSMAALLRGVTCAGKKASGPMESDEIPNEAASSIPKSQVI